MAILEQGILGGGRNAVGTVVMTQWRGKDVIRARVTPSNPQTAAQTTQRDLFALLTQAGASLMDAFVRPYWRRHEGIGRNATTAFNEFVRTNIGVMRTPDLPGEPAGVFDAAQLVLTRGPLEPAEPSKLVEDGRGQTQVQWATDGGPADDPIAVVVTRLDGTLAVVETGVTRGDGALALDVPFAERAGYAFHIVAYRPGATPEATAVGFHGSVRFDPKADDGAGADVIVTGAEKAAAYAARRLRGRVETEVIMPRGALV